VERRYFNKPGGSVEKGEKTGMNRACESVEFRRGYESIGSIRRAGTGSKQMPVSLSSRGGDRSKK